MERLKVLVADDQPHVHVMLKHRLERLENRGIYKVDVTFVSTARAALEAAARSLVETKPFDVVLLDIDFSQAEDHDGMSGHEAAGEIRGVLSGAQIVLVSALSQEEHLRRASKNEAVDQFFRRGSFTDDELHWCCSQALVRRLQAAGGLVQPGHRIYSESSIMDVCLRAADRVRPECNTLISGETGSGKELLARRLHANARVLTKKTERDRPFVAVNCAELNDNLAVGLLFGVVKGAYTGADRDRTGFFDEAQGGDLFLDEFQSAPIELQKILMRTLQEMTYMPLGASRPKTLKARVIVALNKDLSEQKQNGTLMPDLVARVQKDYLKIPPLRERAEDIPMLIRVMLERMGSPDKEFRKDAIEFLKSLKWMENVRGVEKVCTAAVLHCKIPVIGREDLLELDVVKQILREEGIHEQMRDTAPCAVAPRSVDDRLRAIATELAQKGEALDPHVTLFESEYFSNRLAQEGTIAALAKKVSSDRVTLRRKLIGLGVITGN